MPDTPTCDGTIPGPSANLRRPVATVRPCPRPAAHRVAIIDSVDGLRYEQLCSSHTAGAKRRKNTPVDVRPLDAAPFEAPDGLADAARELARARDEVDRLDSAIYPSSPSGRARHRERRAAAGERVRVCQDRVVALLGAGR